MSEIVPFDFEGLQVRTVVDLDGNPWFVAADVCAALEIASVGNAVGRLDVADRGLHLVETPGGRQRVVIVNESGLYDLIIRSDKPQARPFRRWVTSEVLPSIRRTGSYSVERPPTYPELLRAHADEIERREALEAQRAIEAPKVAAYDRVIESEGMYDMSGIADMCGTSVGRFTGWLVDLGVFRKSEYDAFPGRRLPLKRHRDAGLFEVKIEQSASGVHYPVAYATPAGLAFVLDLLRENGLVD